MTFAVTLRFQFGSFAIISPLSQSHIQAHQGATDRKIICIVPQSGYRLAMFEPMATERLLALDVPDDRASQFAEYLSSNGVNVVGKEVVVNGPLGARRFDIVTQDGLGEAIQDALAESRFLSLEEANALRLTADSHYAEWVHSLMERYGQLAEELTGATSRPLHLNVGLPPGTQIYATTARHS